MKPEQRLSNSELKTDMFVQVFYMSFWYSDARFSMQSDISAVESSVRQISKDRDT